MMFRRCARLLHFARFQKEVVKQEGRRLLTRRRGGWGSREGFGVKRTVPVVLGFERLCSVSDVGGDEFNCGDVGEGGNHGTRWETTTNTQSGAGEKLDGDDSVPLPSSFSRPKRSGGKTGTAAFLWGWQKRRMGKQRRSLGEKNSAR